MSGGDIGEDLFREGGVDGGSQREVVIKEPIKLGVFPKVSSLPETTPLSPLRVLLEATKKLPHHQLAQLVVQHIGDMPMMASKARAMGVPAELFIAWMSTDDGHRAIQSIRRGFDEILDSALSTLLHRLYNEVLDRVSGGDYVVDRSTGSIHRQPLRAAVVVSIFERVFEKRDRLRQMAPILTQSLPANGTYPTEEGFHPAANVRDSDALARAMRSMAGRSGLVMRKRVTEESEVIEVDT